MDLYETYEPEEQDNAFWDEVALSTAWARLWSTPMEISEVTTDAA